MKNWPLNISGLNINLGSVAITKEQITEFAMRYDPQPFHLNENAAAGVFGDIAASGWQTVCLCNKLIVDGFILSTVCMGSPGVDKIQFLRPVFVGDVLSVKIMINGTRRFTSKPDRGIAEFNIEVSNGENEPVMSMLIKAIIGCRAGEQLGVILENI